MLILPMVHRASAGYSEPGFAEFYDHIPTYRDRTDVQFFVETAGQTGGPVLELACGTGRVLLPIAKAGIEIVGLDLHPAMLSVCRGKLSKESVEVQRRVSLVEGDMCRFDLGREFRLITIPFRGFQHLLDVEAQMACLERVRRHLAAGGRFILDVFNPDLKRLTDDRYLSEVEESPPFAMPDGRRVRLCFRVISRDLPRQVQEMEFICYVTHPDGRQQRLVNRFSLRHYFRYELEHLLSRCAFRVEALYSDYGRSPMGARDPGELIFVAMKT